MPLNKQLIENRVNSRPNTLEYMLKRNIHLNDEMLFEEVLNMVVKYWPAMNEADREFYEAARWAFDNKKVWMNNEPT